MDDDIGIINIIVDDNSITDETFNNKNIIINFDEYLSINSIGLSNFINYEDKDGTGSEFFISGSILSNKLEKLLKTFDERVIDSPDFIKIKENDKEFIEYTRKSRAFKKFKKSKKNRNIKPHFEKVINLVYDLKQMSGKEIKEAKEYDELISKLIPNLETTVDNFQIIEEAIETIEKG